MIHAKRIRVPPFDGHGAVLHVPGRRDPEGHEAHRQPAVGLPCVASVRNAGITVRARRRGSGRGRRGPTRTARTGRGRACCCRRGRGRTTCTASTRVGGRRLPAEVGRGALGTRVEPCAAVAVRRIGTEALQHRLDAGVVAAVQAKRDIRWEAAIVVDDAGHVLLRRRTRIRRRGRGSGRAAATARPRAGRGRGGHRTPSAARTARRRGRRGRRRTATRTRRGRSGRRGRTASTASPGIRSADVDLVVHHVTDERGAVAHEARRQHLRVAVVTGHAARTQRVGVLAAVELAGVRGLIVPAKAGVRADRAEVAAIQMLTALRHPDLGRGRAVPAARREGHHRHEGDGEDSESPPLLDLAHGHSPSPGKTEVLLSTRIPTHAETIPTSQATKSPVIKGCLTLPDLNRSVK